MIQLQQIGDNIYDHSGINMVLDAIMNFSKPRVDAEALDVNFLILKLKIIRIDCFFLELDFK
jgi:hypothetical protein